MVYIEPLSVLCWWDFIRPRGVVPISWWWRWRRGHLSQDGELTCRRQGDSLSFCFDSTPVSRGFLVGNNLTISIMCSHVSTTPSNGWNSGLRGSPTVWFKLITCLGNLALFNSSLCEAAAWSIFRIDWEHSVALSCSAHSKNKLSPPPPLWAMYLPVCDRNRRDLKWQALTANDD